MQNVLELMRRLPAMYERSAFDSGALVYRRAFMSAERLMQVCLFHLLHGATLLETSFVARAMGLGQLNDTAFMNRFAKCNEWFKRIITHLVTGGAACYMSPPWLEGYRVIALDATKVVRRCGLGNITYRLHFALDLFKMQSLQFKITTEKVGESLRNFKVSPGDLLLADRVYSTYNSMRHCTENGGDFITRMRSSHCIIYDAASDAPINLHKRLKALKKGKLLDLNVYVGSNTATRIYHRICAMHMPEDKLLSSERREHKSNKDRKPKTIEFHQYIVLATSLPKTITSEQILQTYRLRWQVEIYFKRLKSLLQFGVLPKKREDSTMAWLNGKIMLALLIENIQSDIPFSPSGHCQT